MKLATLKNGSRDGRLVVVSKDLTRCADAAEIASTLQAALDDWAAAEPKLQALYHDLNNGKLSGGRLRKMPAKAPAPCLPMADGSAYVNHVELVRKARGRNCPTVSGPIR